LSCVIFKTMLRQLRIRDFAIIDNLAVNFHPGLNVLTGETGAGKSIIVDALGLTLGERAHTDMVRTGGKETAIEAYFDVPAHPLLERIGISADEGIIIRRTLSSAGKSKAYINDTMVNLQTLLDLGRSLVDIHGQHEHQSLLSTDNQMSMLDAYGKLLDARSEVEGLFGEAQSLRHELSTLKRDIKEREQRIDLLKFQINEIDVSALKQGETESLKEERTILANLAKLNELTDSARELLYSGEGSSSEKLSAALSLAKEISRIDPAAGEVLHLLESALPLVEDAGTSLRRYREKYDMDPGKLDEIEERLELIKKLERKYGEGIETILKHRDDAEKELQKLTLSDERVRGLEDDLEKKENILVAKAARLTEMRKGVSGKIGKAVKAILGELGMEKAEFVIDIKAAPLSSTGADSVEFLFSANKGEPPKSLARVASGGELSRIMLALKGILAEVDRVPVLIFDEVDAGIGGRTAEKIGTKLRDLGSRHQVLCITHLPQIAAMAHHHVMIEKAQRKEGVCVKVNELSDKEREEEIARMLGGKVTDISLKHAKELLKRSEADSLFGR
jgi:DNA repair protein RecN (Recombination protein N)